MINITISSPFQRWLAMENKTLDDISLLRRFRGVVILFWDGKGQHTPLFQFMELLCPSKCVPQSALTWCIKLNQLK